MSPPKHPSTDYFQLRPESLVFSSQCCRSSFVFSYVSPLQNSTSVREQTFLPGTLSTFLVTFPLNFVHCFFNWHPKCDESEKPFFLFRLWFYFSCYLFHIKITRWTVISERMQTVALLFPPPSGWRCSARWSTPRSTTSFQPSRWYGGSVASSRNPSSSAVRDTPPNTDAFARAETSVMARWLCAETVYNEGTGEGHTQKN